jgi:hypothetical protein
MCVAGVYLWVVCVYYDLGEVYVWVAGVGYVGEVYVYTCGCDGPGGGCRLCRGSVCVYMWV